MSPAPPIPPAVIAKRIDELRAEVGASETHLTMLRAELAWYEDAKRLFGDARPDPAVELSLPGLASEPATASTNGRKPTLRQAILIVMGGDSRKTWKVEAVISGLRQHGWLPGGDNGEHRTRSVLAQMHRKGEVKRIDRGRYRLPPAPKDDS